VEITVRKRDAELMLVRFDPNVAAGGLPLYSAVSLWLTE
jgi:hypothetical protein